MRRATSITAALVASQLWFVLPLHRKAMLRRSNTINGLFRGSRSARGTSLSQRIFVLIMLKHYRKVAIVLGFREHRAVEIDASSLIISGY